jgi:hypothetical protein
MSSVGSPHILAIVISPPNLISALGATLSRYENRAHLTVAVCDWPGATLIETQERMTTYREMTKKVPLSLSFVQISQQMLTQAIECHSATAMASQVGKWVDSKVDEIQFGHDILDAVYQLACITWPDARRVIFGDGFGGMAMKDDFLDIQKRAESGFKRLTFRYRHRLMRRLNYLRYRLHLLADIGGMPAPEDIRFLPDEYWAYLPICDRGYTIPSGQLRVITKETFQTVLNLVATSLDTGAYEKDLIALKGQRPGFILATENYTEMGVITIEREISMWLEMLEPHLIGNPLVIIKPHPGETQSRWRLLAPLLSGRAEIVEFPRRYHRVPLEVFSELPGQFTFVTSAYLRVTLKYLHNVDIPSPMTEAVITRTFPDWFRSYISWARESQNRILGALERWDGHGLLYRGPAPK